MNKDITPVFKGKIENGKLKVSNRDGYSKWLECLDKKEVVVIIKTNKRLRSLDQLAYYYGVIVPIIADYIGCPTGEAHAFLKQQFLSKELLVNGSWHKIVSSLSLVNVSQMSEYIEYCIRWCSELEIFIPDSNNVDYENKQKY